VIELASWPASISHRLTKTQQLTDAADEPPPTGFPPAPGGFGPTPTAPAIRGAARSIPDALVPGDRIEVDFPIEAVRPGAVLCRAPSLSHFREPKPGSG